MFKINYVYDLDKFKKTYWISAKILWKQIYYLNKNI